MDCGQDERHGAVIRVVDPPRLHAVATALRATEPIVYRHLRAGLRAAGADSVSAVQGEIRRIPSRAGTGAVRGALAAGTRVSIGLRSARSASVTIVTDPGRLPAGKRPLAKAMNKATFRHPVFGAGWVNQQGHPYFGATIRRRQPAMSSLIWRELVAAEREIGARA